MMNKANGAAKNILSSALALVLLFGHQVMSLGVPSANDREPNVIMIDLDQLRADQLYCHGNPRPASPNIDRLAARGVRFSNFFTVAPWTSPSFASLHTSLCPSRHGVTLLWKPGMPLIDKDTPTLVETFRNHGYYTAAFVENSLAGQDLTGRGFDEYHGELCLRR